MIKKIIVSFVLQTIIVGVVHARLLDEPLRVHDIECGESFACPTSIKGRISFWVDVFSRWDTSTAVFHDKEHPERVFSTVSRNEGCRKSRKGDVIDKQRKYLKSLITRTADKVAKNRSLSKTENKIAKLFEGVSVSEMKRSAERIRCQSGNKDRMQTALEHFQLYRPTILDALESQNLTLELQYLPFVESAFNPEALSHVGAAGLWQIMPSTGRKLGLLVDNVVDERYDPKRATYGAAKYFRDSVDDLTEAAISHDHTVTTKQLNPFVVTSYNYGVRGMQRAIAQVGLDYERLLAEYKSPNFQTAVKNFYSSFIAARHVAKNVEMFFGDITPNFSDQIHSYNLIKLKRPTSIKRLSTSLNIDRDTLKKMNPALKRVVWKDQALVPIKYKLKLPYKDSDWDNELVRMDTLPTEYEKPGYLWHKVRTGQNACGIARRYKASCKQLWRLNNLNRKGTIYAGKRIKVPTSTGGIYTINSKTPQLVSNNESSTLYKVKSGDTACSIARRYKMKCDELLAVNGLTRRSLIKIGQTLSVLNTNSWHVVRSGQTACGIARSYQVSCSKLLAVNDLSRNGMIRIGQRLQLPLN